MSAIGARYPMKVKSASLTTLFFVADKGTGTAKIFIKLLLNPDPAQRPTALEAYNNHVSHCLAHPLGNLTHDVWTFSG